MRAFLLLLGLVACTYYPDDCNRRALQELRTVERLIAETQQNLARGFTYETEDYGYRSGFMFCTGGYPVAFCSGNDLGYSRRPVAVDPDAERRKLESLVARREALSSATASCVAT